MQIKIFILFACTFSVNVLLAQKDIELEKLFNLEISPDERNSINDKIAEFSQLIKSEPENYINYYNRGVMYGKLGLHPDAITDYNNCIKLNPDCPQAYYNRGLSKARFGVTKVACVDVKKAGELGYGQAKNFYNAKCGLFKPVLGDFSE